MSDRTAITRSALLRGAAGALGAGLVERILGGWARASTAKPGELTIAQGADVAHLDPHFSTDLGALFSIYDTLVARRGDIRLHPSLATRWRLLGPTVWEFELRRGVRFHNGDPFTAEDVKFSIERTYDPKARTRVASIFGGVERVEAPDPGRVLFRMRRPDALLPARLAFYGGQILPKRYVEKVGSDGLNASPVGTGPVRFVERVMGDRLVLEAAPDYWGEGIDATRVIFKPVPEMATRVAALLRGEVDLTTDITPDHVARIEQNPATRVEEVLLAGFFVLAVNSRRPPLDNPLIKQALSLAIDRGALVKTLWHGRGLVPNGPIPRGDSFYDDTLPPLAHDPDLARRRLAAAGYTSDVIVLESTAGYLANDKPMGEAIVSMWREVGVNAQLEIVEPSVMAQKAREKTFKGLRWAGPISTLGDPDGMMWRLLGPGGALDTWRHSRFDELGRAAQISHDPEFRRGAYREMTVITLEHVPWIPILQPMLLYGVRREVDWRAYANGQIEIRRFNLRVR